MSAAAAAFAAGDFIVGEFESEELLPPEMSVILVFYGKTRFLSILG
jgi:hypothetical protein